MAMLRSGHAISFGSTFKGNEMNILSGGRCCGRTIRLVEKIKALDGTLIVANQRQVNDIINVYGLKRHQVKSLEELQRGRLKGSSKSLWIANIEDLIREACEDLGGIRVIGVIRS